MTIINVNSNLNSYLDVDVSYYLLESFWSNVVETFCKKKLFFLNVKIII